MGGEQHRQKPETEEEEAEEADESRRGMREMFYSGDESIHGGRDTSRASCLLSVSLIILCYLVNAICPTLLSFLEVCG